MLQTANQFKKLQTIFSISYSSLILLTIFFTFSSLLDLISLSLIVPLVGYLINPSKVYEELLIVKYFITDSNFLIVSTIMLIVVFFLKTIVSIINLYLIKKFSLTKHKNLQLKLFQIYQQMEYSSFIKRNKNEYIRNIQELSKQSTICLEESIKLFSETIVLISILIFLLSTQFKSVIILTAILSANLYFYNLYFKKKLISYGKNQISKSKLILKIIQNTFDGFKEILILNKQNFFYTNINKSINEKARYDLLGSVIGSSPRFLLELIIVIFIISYFIIFNQYNYNKTQDIIPIISVFAFAALRIIPSSGVIAKSITSINYHYHAIDKVYKDINNLTTKKKRIRFDKLRSIEFKNVSFNYPGSKNLIFNKLNFKFTKGKIIGIVGRNGSGKSTLVDLILGLLKPIKGYILINKKVCSVDPSMWIGQISYMPQDNIFLNESIKTNITMNPNSSNYINAKIYECLRMSTFLEFVNKLPRKINTIIGENGISLSGGQYKKLALSRLFYNNSSMLIMDEATNSLDQDSEKLVTNEIKKLKKKKTVIIISHKKESLRYCDLIFKITNKKFFRIK
jgi:ABC-type bacteriocin/lantibiotic exporter with double-glycine peptidase domain